jgi:hypothetical protein
MICFVPQYEINGQRSVNDYRSIALGHLRGTQSRSFINWELAAFIGRSARDFPTTVSRAVPIKLIQNHQQTVQKRFYQYNQAKLCIMTIFTTSHYA